MRVVLYSLIRVALILAAGALLYLAGMRSWLLWITAILVGAMVSFLVLRRETAEVSQSLVSLKSRRGGRARTGAQHDADVEDALVEGADPSVVEDARGSQGDGEDRPVDEDEQPRP